MHDPLDAFDLVADEIDQRRESGFDVQEIEAAFRQTDTADESALRILLDRLDALTRSGAWPYDEPSDLDAIVATLPAATADPAAISAGLDDRILGGWLGRIAGCNVGKPVEDGLHWTSAHIQDYLERAGAYPLLDYVPAMEPMPAGFRFRDNWTRTTRGRVDGSDRDDDIDYAILGLYMLEQHGAALTPDDVAKAWLTYLPYFQVYTAERAVYRSLLQGVPARSAAAYQNPYREWIGALIRGDAFGWTHPGDPRRAAMLAFQDASLSHVTNGIYGEMWSAALVASAFTATDARDALVRSLDHIPPRSRLSEAILHVLELHAAGSSWSAALASIQARYGHYSWVHTVNNAAVITAGLLWGDGDYASSVGLTVQGGWDTDSNGATAGSVAGVLVGARALPSHFVEPLHDRTRSALFGFDGSRISDLAERTTRLARTFAA